MKRIKIIMVFVMMIVLAACSNGSLDKTNTLNTKYSFSTPSGVIEFTQKDCISIDQFDDMIVSSLNENNYSEFFRFGEDIGDETYKSVTFEPKENVYVIKQENEFGVTLSYDMHYIETYEKDGKTITKQDHLERQTETFIPGSRLNRYSYHGDTDVWEYDNFECVEIINKPLLMVIKNEYIFKTPNDEKYILVYDEDKVIGYLFEDYSCGTYFVLINGELNEYESIGNEKYVFSAPLPFRK